MQFIKINRAELRYRVSEVQEFVALVTWLLLVVFFVFSADHFVSWLVVSNILTFASTLGIITIGVANLMIAGEFDLSVGAILAVSGYIFALTINAGVPALLAMLIALGVSVLLGAINGLIVVSSRIPSFIMTLGTMLAYRGIARAIGGGDLATFTGEKKPALFAVLNGAITPLNDLFSPAANFRTSILWFLGLAVVMSFVLMRTPFGNWTFASGGNEGAAIAQGVHTRKVKVINFMLSGLFAGFAGVVQFSYRTSIDPLRGEGMELLAVAASVIGGVLLTGGLGTIFGASVGVLLLGTLDQGLVLMKLPIQVFRAVAGFILLISVTINTWLGYRE